MIGPAYRPDGQEPRTSAGPGLRWCGDRRGAGRVDQSPTFLAASVTAWVVFPAVLAAEVVVALALLRAGAEVFFAVLVVYLAADLAVLAVASAFCYAVVAAAEPCFLAVVVVSSPALAAWVLTDLALAFVVPAVLAAFWVESCLRMRTTRSSPRSARPT